jgi:DNA polymerase-4
VGIGDNKLQAKLATSFGKPDGVGRLSSAEWVAVMGPRPVDALWGVGSRTRRRLEALGVRTVDDLAATPAADLAAEFGPRTGPWLRRLGRGADSSPVDPTPWVPRAHGREETVQHDLDDWDEVAALVRRLAAQVADDIAAEGRPAVRVAVKIRYVPFETKQRTRKLAAPESDAAALGEAGVALLDGFDHDRRVRLVGFRAEMAEPGATA